MQARRFPARQGWVWLREGFMLWRKSPLALTGACLTMTMLLVLSAVVPLLGQVLPALLLPPLGVGLFRLCSELKQRGMAVPGMLFSGFRLHLPRQMMIGAMRLTGQIACVLLAAKIAGIDPSESLGKLSADGSTLTVSPNLEAFLGWGMALGLPLELLFWFTPQLVALAGISPLKAVFFNIVSCWRNLGALIVCLLLWALLFAFLPALLINLIGSALPALGGLLLAPLFVIMVPVFYASFHASACDIFGEVLEK
jgi:hypothetical protein